VKNVKRLAEINTVASFCYNDLMDSNINQTLSESTN